MSEFERKSLMDYGKLWHNIYNSYISNNKWSESANSIIPSAYIYLFLEERTFAAVCLIDSWTIFLMLENDENITKISNLIRKIEPQVENYSLFPEIEPIIIFLKFLTYLKSFQRTQSEKLFEYLMTLSYENILSNQELNYFLQIINQGRPNHKSNDFKIFESSDHLDWKTKLKEFGLTKSLFFRRKIASEWFIPI